jgi:hypothetical protein
VLAASVIALDPWPAIAGALLTAVALHGIVRFPRATERLIQARDGSWALPSRGLAGLRLARGTAWGDTWVDLVLAGSGRRVRVLLLRDQLGAEDWRRLQVAVRESDDGPG